MDERAQAILDYWFGDLNDDYDPGTRGAIWWKKDPDVDAEIRERFGDDFERAVAGELDGWADEPRSCLALVILLDQFSRNLFRDDPRAWANDAEARAVALAAIDRGHDRALKMVERQFLYMPLMHSEDVDEVRRHCELADACVAAIPDDRMHGAFEGWTNFARQHLAIVERFGRYPHRNAVLGRTSTDEERAFLQEPGSSF